MTTKRKRTAKRPTTALVRRRPAPVTRPMLPARRPSKTELTLEQHVRRLESLSSTTALDDSIQLGDYGLTEITLTGEEEEVLAAPIGMQDIRVKPTGQVYLPHIVYTRWLNRAFGRTGWALRPASKPLLNNNTVVVPYILLVHGKPVAFALGEQEYFGNNRDQSYGDALESTVASGLRRCCKHLGLALELWDRSFGDQFLEEYCVRVKVEVDRDGKKTHRYHWRRKIDTPFYNEVRTGRRNVEEGDFQDHARTVTPAAHYDHGHDPITPEQLRRLWTISRRRQRPDEEVKAFLAFLGFASSKEIPRDKYETIVAAIEHPGPLPVDSRREPGAEG